MIRARLHRIRPGVGAALALLTLASPLLVTFHQAAVRHVTCPEHGELVDAPVEAPHPHAQPSTGLPGLFAERDPAGPSDAGEEHEHCSISLQGQVRATDQSLKPFVVTAPEVVAPSPPEGPERRRREARRWRSVARSPSTRAV